MSTRADSFQRRSSIKRVQLEIRINVSLQFHEIEPKKYPHSQTITFRLSNPSNSPPPPPPTTTATKIEPIISEVYFNPRLSEKLQHFQPKLHVDLSYSNLIDRDITLISKEIIEKKKCTELWLYGNRLTGQGIKLLASSLKDNSTLKCLDLSYNQIADAGIEDLCQVLSSIEHHSVIKILYLSKNQISDNGVKHLSQMLQTNQTLKELWLSENEITDQGVEQLAKVLGEQNKTLKYLSLSTNTFITDKSIDYLSEMLKTNQTLRKLWMKDCNLTEEGKRKLRDLAKQKKKFRLEL